MRLIRAIYLPLLLPLLVGCGETEGEPVSEPPLHGEATVTPYTIRLPGGDPEEMAIILTQTVYPATREDTAVGAIILAPQDEPTAFLAMQRVTHMPVNAPLLYLSTDGTISEATLTEMKRLRPDGVLQDGRTQVYALNVPASQVERIRRELHYDVRAFHASDPIPLSEELDRWQAAMKADYPDEVIISALDHPDGLAHGVGPMGWNAHMGKGFAWVWRDSIPEETRRILERRPGAHACYIYLTGGPDVISDRVARELSRYGAVRRIYGDDIYATSTVNAGYKDYGRNFGWGLNWRPRAFGWGIAQAGHNFIICNPENLLMVFPAALLGHMGKHGPILLVRNGEVPESVVRYLRMVRPNETGPQQTILNFAWIIGDETVISREVQQQIDPLLYPFPVNAGLMTAGSDTSDALRSDSVGVDTLQTIERLQGGENEGEGEA